MPVAVIQGHTNFFEAAFEAFGHKVSIMFCDDVKKAIAEQHPEAPKQDDAEALSYFYTTKAESELYFHFDVAAGTVAHEAFHAVWNLFEYHGVKSDDENIAYHLGYLVNEITLAQREARKVKEDYARLKEQQNLGIVCWLL